MHLPGSPVALLNLEYTAPGINVDLPFRNFHIRILIHFYISQGIAIIFQLFFFQNFLKMFSKYTQSWLYINLGCITNCNIICASHAKHLSWCFSLQSNIEFRMCWSTRNQTWLSFIKGHLLVNCLSIWGISTQSVKKKKSYKGGLQFLVKSYLFY